jgi:hypothetical protein
MFSDKGARIGRRKLAPLSRFGPKSVQNSTQQHFSSQTLARAGERPVGTVSEYCDDYSRAAVLKVPD